MHIFITGISGFVGGRLARVVRQAGGRASGIFVADRPPPEVGATWEVDLLDRPALERALSAAGAEVPLDAVVHLAALSSVGASWERMGDYFRVNVLGTENLLAAVAASANGVASVNGTASADRSVPPVIFASSAEVYGAVADADQPLGEERLPAPASPYALTKAAAECLAVEAGAIVVRSFNLVGAGQAPTFALPSFARQLAAIEAGAAEPVLRVGNLTARRDFVHVADGLEAYRLLAREGRPGEVYNLASGEAVSLRQALDRLMVISGVEARVEADPQRMRPVDVPLLSGNSAKLRRLGWQPRHTLDDALAELWDEARQERAA